VLGENVRGNVREAKCLGGKMFNTRDDVVSLLSDACSKNGSNIAVMLYIRIALNVLSFQFVSPLNQQKAPLRLTDASCIHRLTAPDVARIFLPASAAVAVRWHPSEETTLRCDFAHHRHLILLYTKSTVYHLVDTRFDN